MDYAHKKTDEAIKKLERRIKKEYQQAEKEIKEKFNNYAKSFKVKDAEKKGLLADGKITQTEYSQWRQGQILTGKRWKELQQDLAQDYKNAAVNAQKLMRGEAMDVYALNHNYGAFQIETASGINTNFTIYDKHTVGRLLMEQPKLLPERKINEAKAVRYFQQKVSSAVTQGVLQGESLPKVADRLNDITGMGYRSSVRQARTAMTAAQNAGRVDSYKEAEDMGIEMTQMWLATLDNRTRHSHVELDGECVPVGEEFSNGCKYPADPDGEPEEVYNCRCTLMAQLKGFEKDPSDMSWRNDSALDGQSYEDWKAGKKAEPEEAEPETPNLFDGRDEQDIIDNAEVYSEDWHIENNFSHDDWEELTADERTAVKKYTGSYYTEMNEQLRGVAYHGADYQKLIDNCASALDKSEIAEDTLLYRGMGSYNTLARAIGISKDELIAASSDGSLSGMTFIEKGFCSTGINSGAGWDKRVNLEIIAPKGAKGMYVDPISRHHGERELLLQKGCEFKILNYEEDWGDLILKVLLIGQG